MKFKKIKEIISKPIYAGVVAGVVTIGTYLITVSSQYQDVIGGDKCEAGRTKNSIATLVSGAISHELNPDKSNDFEFNCGKLMYPDSTINGMSTPYSIDSEMKLWFSGVNFHAQKNNEGKFNGEVHKSEFNWKVNESKKGEYDINRFGPKFDSKLQLELKDGIIDGVYERYGPHFDWKIDGTYDNSGNVKCRINVPLGMDITLEGKVSPLGE